MRELLTPLPEPLWEAFDLVATREVTHLDGLVAFEGRHYSVPFPFVRTSVEVRGCEATIQVVHGSQIIAVHPRPTNERLVINPSHYDGSTFIRNWLSS